MKLVFAGTPAFAVPALEALRSAGHIVHAVYTQPDRPAGRGRHLTESAVKQCARAHGLDIRQPQKIAGEEARLRRDAPDALIVIAYGLLLPPAMLAIPRFGGINVHASLLPRWRGAAPIARAIEAGDAETGISIMQMEAGLDTGPVLAQVREPIAETDTAQNLHDRLAQLGAEILVATLDQLARSDISPQPQDETRASYAPKLRKEEAPLDWNKPAEVLHRKIHAFNPWPVACTSWRGKALRLWSAAVVPRAGSSIAPGTILRADAEGIEVQTGEGALVLRQLQAPGGTVLSARDFLNGHPLQPGERLGNETD